MGVSDPASAIPVGPLDISAYLVVVIFLLLGAGFAVVNLLLAWCVYPKMPSEQDKLSAYECGEAPIGTGFVQFNLRFYVYALIFVIFDVEVIFIFPWAVVFKSLGIFAFVEMMIFIGILMVGYAYAWRKGALEWT